MPWPTAAKHSTSPATGQAERTPLDHLASRAPRLANVVESTSRRRDVRDLRARLLVLMLELRCPITARATRRSWYVPGAVARIGAEGLRRAWVGFYGGQAPCLRTVRSHLGALTRACAIATAPGDWLPTLQNPEHPERRPRYPDTIHLLDTDAEAVWWSTAGRALLEKHPAARYSPDAWRATFQRWRQRAADAALDLVGSLFDGLDEAPIVCGRERGRTYSSSSSRAAIPGVGCTPRAPELLGDLIARAGIESSGPGRGRAAYTRGPTSNAELAAGFRQLALCDTANALELLSAGRNLGLEVQGRNTFELARDPDRLRGTLALLAVAYARGDTIRNRAGWVVRNYRNVSAAERTRALCACRRTQDGNQHPRTDRRS